MLCGLLVTTFWIPRAEYGPDGAVKALEEWGLGREKNGFAETKLARLFSQMYKQIANMLNILYLWLDKVTGGDEAEKRQIMKEQARVQESDHAEAL